MSSDKVVPVGEWADAIAMVSPRSSDGNTISEICRAVRRGRWAVNSALKKLVAMGVAEEGVGERTDKMGRLRPVPVFRLLSQAEQKVKKSAASHHTLEPTRLRVESKSVCPELQAAVNLSQRK